MKFSPETLMAYADGELDPDTRRAIEAAMQTDAEIAEQVERHRALRSQLGTAFDTVLDEPVPSRLMQAAQASPAATAGNVVDLAGLRATKAQAPSVRRRWSWPEWTSIAASLIVGVIVGRAALQSAPSNLVAADDGRIVARGALATALSNQIGIAQQDNTTIAVGLSFRAKSGEYCRTFATRQDSSLAGYACRSTDVWRVHALMQADSSKSGDYRMATTDLPLPLLEAVQQSIAGDALDAQEEAAARERGWKR
jgi:hypothetical protein